MPDVVGIVQKKRRFTDVQFHHFAVLRSTTREKSEFVSQKGWYMTHERIALRARDSVSGFSDGIHVLRSPETAACFLSRYMRIIPSVFPFTNGRIIELAS